MSTTNWYRYYSSIDILGIQSTSIPILVDEGRKQRVMLQSFRIILIASIILALALAGGADEEEERMYGPKCGTQKFGGITEFPVTNCPMKCTLNAMKYSHIVYLHHEARYVCCCKPHEHHHQLAHRIRWLFGAWISRRCANGVNKVTCWSSESIHLYILR